MNPFDPQHVHPGTCRSCDAWVRDNETMTDGECWPCAEATQAAIAEDQAAFDAEEPVKFDREMFDLRVRAEWELG